MRKRVKQTAALVLALGMAVAESVTGYASSVVVPTTSPTVVSAVDPNGTKTELVGTINITSLSVTLPLKAGFNIDPSKYDGTAGAQIGDNQSALYKIINNSAVPVYVSISGVAANDGLDALSGAKTISLVNAVNNLDTQYSVMLAIKDTSATAPAVGTPADWLTDATTSYALNTTDGKLEAKSGSTPTELSLKIYGLTKGGWAQGDKFRVAPTFLVSTVAP